MSLRPVSNPPSPWTSIHREWLDAPPTAKLEVFEETAKSILSKNESPDLPFSYSLNPYRGCHHACGYCYARNSHQYWDLGAGTDFDTKIIVKTNAPEILRESLMRPSWKGDWISISGNTDCYQPLEASYKLTRRCLEVCSEFRQPVGIITKGALIRRDIDLLQDLKKNAQLSVYVSLAFSDDDMARKIEPYAPRPSTRLDAIRALTEAGIDVGIALAPIIPGLNDSQIAEILERASDAGARHAFRLLLRLPLEVKDVFFSRLAESFPDRSQKVVHGLQALQGGQLYRSEFGQRGKGEGPRWQAIDWLFQTACKKYGINQSNTDDLAAATSFRRPGEQLTLFGDPLPLKRPRKKGSRPSGFME